MTKAMVGALASAAAILAAAPASAAVITLNNTTATWFSPAGGGGTVTYGANGTGSANISWGTPVPSNGAKSRYNFTTAGNHIVTNVPPTTPFTIGTFTHYNNPIAVGTQITAVGLRLTTDLVIDGADLGIMNFAYMFHHDETPNQRPCDYGSLADAPCPDAVTVTAMPSSQTFLVNGVAYTLSFSDFVQNGASTNRFVSPEGRSNMADIRAMVTAVAVPEPATWALLFAGFGLVGRAMRQRARLRPASGV